MRLDPHDFWIAGATAVCLMLGVQYARAHSWFDPWCCNGDDCKPIDANEVREMPDGYHYREWVITYKDARVSLDREFYACEYPKGTMRCFYAPIKGM